MSRATARTAIKERFSGQVDGIKTVHKSFRRILKANEFIDTGRQSGAVLVPFIVRERETRIAVGGEHDGMKRVDYTVQLQLFFKSVKQDWEEAMDDLDAIVEALKARIRSDRTLASSDVWQFGEGTEGLAVEYGEPVLNGNAMDCWAQVTCILTEMIHS